MCRPQVVAANRASAGPAARCSAYRLSPAFSRSRESNRPTPCTARNSAHSLTARAYASHVPGACAPLAGSSRSHWLTATDGRGAPGPSSNSRSSSTSTGIRSGISGRCPTSQDSQPCDEKKFRITNRNHRNTTQLAAQENHSSHRPLGLIATRQLSRENPPEPGGADRAAGIFGDDLAGRPAADGLAVGPGGEVLDPPVQRSGLQGAGAAAVLDSERLVGDAEEELAGGHDALQHADGADDRADRDPGDLAFFAGGDVVPVTFL